MSGERITGKSNGRNDHGAASRSLALRMAGLCLCVLLGGCAAGQPAWMGGSSSGQATAGAEARPGGSLAEFIGNSAQGLRGTVDDPAYGTVQVSVGEAYVSALGEACRKAEVSGGRRLPQPEIFASCQGGDSKWRLVPPVMPPQRAFQVQK